MRVLVHHPAPSVRPDGTDLAASVRSAQSRSWQRRGDQGRAERDEQGNLGCFRSDVAEVLS
jgi:hypothetical protein